MSIICNSFSLCLSFRVTATKLSEGLHLQAQQKSTAKKVAISSGFSFTVTSSGGLLFSYPFSFVLFYISLRLSSKSEYLLRRRTNPAFKEVNSVHLLAGG